MWTKNSNPKKGGWHICIADGNRLPLTYNEFNKFWCGLDGKTYKPNEVEWLDDSKVKQEGAEENKLLAFPMKEVIIINTVIRLLVESDYFEDATLPKFISKKEANELINKIHLKMDKFIDDFLAK